MSQNPKSGLVGVLRLYISLTYPGYTRSLMCFSGSTKKKSAERATKTHVISQVWTKVLVNRYLTSLLYHLLSVIKSALHQFDSIKIEISLSFHLDNQFY